MKKITLLLAFTLSVLFIQAQSTTPRFGVPPRDNTGRVLTYRYVAVTDAAGADSITLNPRAWENIYVFNLVDSIYLKTPGVTNSYCGDIIKIILEGTTSGNKIKLNSGWIYTSSSFAVSTKKKGVISFIFDGTNWVETGRQNY
jgi:hypothetical protein